LRFASNVVERILPDNAGSGQTNMLLINSDWLRMSHKKKIASGWKWHCQLFSLKNEICIARTRDLLKIFESFLYLKKSEKSIKVNLHI
jgi:hypothetical protein